MSSLRDFIDDLPPNDILRITAPIDHVPTALVMELEKQGRSPVLLIDPDPAGEIPVVLNLFGTRERIARIAGLDVKQLFPEWGRFLANPVKPRVVQSGPAQDVILT